MTVLAFPQRDAFEITVIGPGKGKTYENNKKSRGQQDDFQGLTIYHSLFSQNQ